MSIIEVKDLCKEYSYYEKEEGIKEVVRSFFRREKLTKQAVDHISFEIKHMSAPFNMPRAFHIKLRIMMRLKYTEKNLRMPIYMDLSFGF